jgi:orotate phosphoribosyltransferase
MTNDLFQQYLAAGLIQFGRFGGQNGEVAPLSLNFLLLPSFPALMQQTARALVPLLESTPANRILAARQAIPLGAALAIESGVPLTYPYGEAKSYTNAFVIEGAYDVGHPTALLTDALADAEDVVALLEPARKVGLNIIDVLCLFTVGTRGLDALAAQNIRVHTLLSFGDALAALDDRHGLTNSLKGHVAAWLER